MLNNVTADNAADFNFALSDGTPVTFSKITNKGRIQVRLPEDHEFGDDQLRIFDLDGNHYKDLLDGLTLVATQKAAVVTDTPAPTNDLYTQKVVILNGVAFALHYIGPVVDLKA